ncbi:MAG: hypothetical protein Q8Q09_02830 [Deltaproteobacteria bacterium]|nr:hypothetical protein [Deltaproteobacteria bacterium]
MHISIDEKYCAGAVHLGGGVVHPTPTSPIPNNHPAPQVHRPTTVI